MANLRESKMAIEFRIDTREKDEVVTAFLELQAELESRGMPCFDVVREQLDVGDIVAGNLCFERKEGDDFAGSICDGRLKEQADKMALNFESMYYIIVGQMFNPESNMNPRSMIGAQVSLIQKHNAKFMIVPDNRGLAWAVYSTVKKHEEGHKFDPEKKELKIYKTGMTRCDIIVNMLACTGIGWERAKVIAEFSDYSFDILKDYLTDETMPLMKIDGIADGTVIKLRRVFVGELNDSPT